MPSHQEQSSLQRRHFLRAATTIAGGLAVSSKAIAQTISSNSLNIAIIGTGTQGQKMINVCSKIPDIRIAAICDVWENYNLNRSSQILDGLKHEHKTYTRYEDLLEKENGIDAVFIATPDAFHEKQTLDALSAGKHVYCESMMSNTVEGARSMVKAAKDTGKLLQTGYQRRSNPYYLYGRQQILNETRMLGRLVALNAQWNRPVQPDRGFPKRFPVAGETLQALGYDSMPQFRNWMWYQKFSGGPIAELGSHQTDVFNWFLNSYPISITATGGTDYYDQASHENPDTVMALYEYAYQDKPVRAQYQTINANSNFGYYESFMGDEGTLYMSESSGRNKVYHEPNAPDWAKWENIGIIKNVLTGKKPKPKDPEVVGDVQESVIPPEYDLPVPFNGSVLQPHIENFFNAIKGKEQLNCPAETGFAATVCTIKTLQAVREHQKIVLQESDFLV